MKITDSKGLLTPDQIKLLQDAASLPFSLGEYNSLNYILTSLNVDIVVEDGVRYHDIPYDLLCEAEAYWRKRYDEAAEQCRNQEGRSKDMNEAEDNLSEIHGMSNFMGQQMLLGLYVPADNHIILYPQAMNTIDGGSRMNELLVSVLAHETMHAYFNRPGHEMFPYAMLFEEPLAEFGMLIYLEETKSPYLSNAYAFVAGKKTCYRFGAKYYDEHKAGDTNHRHILEDYKFELENGAMTILPSLLGVTMSVNTKEIGLSKSRYTLSRQCQKALWLSVYDKEKQTVNPGLQARFEEGNMVGVLAMGLLGPYVDVTVKVGDGSLDLASMIQRTKDCLASGVENICEASFAFRNELFGKNYCAVDILHKNGDGYDIYEVKSSTDELHSDDDYEDVEHDKNLEKYVRDIAYQKWVLQKCGIKVNDCYLVRINKEYRKKRPFYISDFFTITKMNDSVEAELLNVENNVIEAKFTLDCYLSEPLDEIGPQCNKPYECAFKNFCFKDVPKPSVLDLYKMNWDKRWELFNSGKILFSDLNKGDRGNSTVRNLQVEGKPHIDKPGIEAFLSKIKYPLYFLDFETMMFAIPPYDGLKPYQQIPFQYSLHFQAADGGTLYHTEYLAESGVDPRRKLAEQLCKDIPLDSCVIAYNKSFEEGRLKELAEFFPDLSAHLQNIADHLVDLIEPFRAGHYYLPAMGGSLSIKSVLPALFPNDPQFDYHNLSGGVQNGGEAMTVFPKIKNMAEPQKSQTRKALLDYCKLDTLAMVKIMEKLYDAIK